VDAAGGVKEARELRESIASVARCDRGKLVTEILRE
jgi:hypothetical protein